MGDERSERESARPMDPNAPGKTAGANTQSQGGIGAKLAQAAREEFDAATGSPAAPLDGSIRRGRRWIAVAATRRRMVVRITPSAATTVRA